MAFRISSRPDITESIPASLGRAGARAARESTDKSFDIGIGGMGFNLRANGQHPYMREADAVRKEQFDASDQAGEQSLGTWWRRSQNDWSMGEGVEWYEPGARPESTDRYWAGQGVDPWTQGKLTLLHRADVEQTATGEEPVYVSTFRHDNQDGYVVAAGDTIEYYGPTLSGEVRTNHLTVPAFTSRTVDGTAPTAISYASSTSGYRRVSFTGTSNVGSYVLSSAPRGGPMHVVSDLPAGALSAACNVSSESGSASIKVTLIIGFYNADGEHIESFGSDEIVSPGGGVVTRMAVTNFTPPEGATQWRASVRVTRNVGTVFISGDAHRVGLAIVEAGGIVGQPFSGSSTDADGVDYAWVGAANASKSTATRAPVGSITLAGGGLTQPVIGGQRVYFGRTDVVGFTTPGGSATTVATCTGQARVWWVKSRLLVAVGQKVYWVNHTVSDQVLETNGILIADGGDGWEWVDIADSPDSILMAGHDGTNSYVYSVTVTEGEGGTPEFTAASEVARMPYGERITCMGTYLGAYIALGTSLGIRTGIMGEGGRVQYGPILKRLGGVRDVSFYDSFAYFAVTAGHPDGSSGLWRVDLSTEITDTGRNPYASDLYATTAGESTSIAFMGGSGRPVFAVGRDVYLESSEFVDVGWFTNGKVRFRTTAPKDFQHLSISGVLNGGTFDHRATVPGTTEEHRIVTQTPQTGLPLASLDVQGGPLFEWMQVKTYLRPGLASTTPEIHAWSLAAIPQPERSRLIRLPLQVADLESGTYGARFGYKGFAFDRVSALESAEDQGVPLLVEDARTGESFVASIESVQFTGVDNSDKAKTNFGGWLDVTVRVRR